jgi:hypothetical protein
MMNGGGDDSLHAAHARIRSLEGQIRAARANPAIHEPGRARRILAGLLFVVLVFAITLWAGLRFAQHSSNSTTPVRIPTTPSAMQSAPSLAPRPAAGELTFQCLDTYPFGPSFIDLDNDGVSEIVSLAWWPGPGHDQAALYVVAFDRKTLAVRWRSPGHSARCGDLASRLFVDFSRVVVRDDADTMYVLDSKTGDHTIVTIARDEQKSPQNTGSPDHRLPVVTETTSDKKALVTAAMRKLDAMGGSVSGPTYAMSISIFDLVDLGGPRVTIANARVNDLESRDMAFGFDATNNAIVWQTPLTSPEEKPMVDPPKAVNAWTMLSGGKLSHLYQRSDGGYAISVRSSRTGALLRDVLLNVDGGAVRVGAGAPIGGVTSDENEVFFYLADALVVFDLESFTSRVIRAF